MKAPSPIPNHSAHVHQSRQGNFQGQRQRSANLQKEARALRENPTAQGLRQFLTNTKPEENGGKLNKQQLREQHQAANRALVGSNHRSELWSTYNRVVQGAIATTGQENGQGVSSSAYDKLLQASQAQLPKPQVAPPPSQGPKPQMSSPWGQPQRPKPQMVPSPPQDPKPQVTSHWGQVMPSPPEAAVDGVQKQGESSSVAAGSAEFKYPALKELFLDGEAGIESSTLEKRDEYVAYLNDLYEESPTFKKVVDNYLAENGAPIKMTTAPNSIGVARGPAHVDPKEQRYKANHLEEPVRGKKFYSEGLARENKGGEPMFFIGEDGKVFKDQLSPKRVFLHEFLHLTAFTGDSNRGPGVFAGQNMLQLPGDNVRLTNTILSESKTHQERPRASYFEEASRDLVQDKVDEDRRLGGGYYYLSFDDLQADPEITRPLREDFLHVDGGLSRYEHLFPDGGSVTSS